ncbi:MAG: ABC transporter ATP-binding protein [Alphaproteobacteria bacterium]|nr:ABC transporter ATP-binding protein [Alphaproteobacteria bacterium]
MAAVVVEHLTKSFGAVRAVDDVSFVVAEGSILCLLGPSGCGKTTVLRSIAGLETPDGGRIRLGDRAVFDAASGGVLVPAEARNLGMVFQAYAIWPHMTVFDNVAFGLRVRGKTRTEIERAVAEALGLVRLSDLAARYPSQLSGGQQQRVVLARCLAYRPSLLLLDEPLANLDARLRDEMRAELRRIQRATSTTMIAVTHDQEEALALGDRVMVMDRGRVVQDGTPEEIWRRPAHPFVADFLGTVNRLRGRAIDAATIEIAGIGRVALDHGHAGAVEVCLRPSGAMLVAPEPASPNRWPAVVETSTFVGEQREIVVRCGTASLALRVPAEGAAAAGAAVTLAIDPARLILFRAEA